MGQASPDQEGGQVKAKPKVFTRDGAWWIDLPPFGFGRNCRLGPYPSWQQAMLKLRDVHQVRGGGLGSYELNEWRF